MGMQWMVVAVLFSVMTTTSCGKLEPTWGLQHEYLRNAGCSSWRWNATACRGGCDLSTSGSVIILHEPTTNGAGLGDRLFIISHAVTLAKALCARVSIAPPHMMLSPTHNQGMHGIQCGWRWSRYFDLAATAVDEWNLPARCQNKVVALTAQQHAATRRGCLPVSDMSEAFEVFKTGELFALSVAMGDFRSGVLQSSCRQHISDLQSNSCSQDAFLPSPMVQSAVESFVGSFGGGPFATLHIRRGDTVKLGCDTSPARVGMFLNCRLGHQNGSFPAIILFTDERDGAYIESVLKVLRAHSAISMHGDAELSALLKQNGAADLDNYLIYVASSAVKGRARIQLEFGGHRESSMMAAYCDRQVRCERSGNAQGMSLV